MRLAFFNDIATKIKVNGVTSVERDTAFDDNRARNAGIQLNYASRHPLPAVIKTGILLELGFDTVAPNRQCDISSWAYDEAAASGIERHKDNLAATSWAWDDSSLLALRYALFSKRPAPACCSRCTLNAKPRRRYCLLLCARTACCPPSLVTRFRSEVSGSSAAWRT